MLLQLIEHLPLAVIQVEPAGQQQPTLTLDEPALLATLAEELGSPHSIHRLIGMLHHMELAKDDLSVRYPLQNALRNWLTHIHAGSLNSAPLHGAQFLGRKLIQRCLLALGAKP